MQNDDDDDPSSYVCGCMWVHGYVFVRIVGREGVREDCSVAYMCVCMYVCMYVLCPNFRTGQHLLLIFLFF